MPDTPIETWSNESPLVTQTCLYHWAFAPHSLTRKDAGVKPPRMDLRRICGASTQWVSMAQIEF